MFKFVRALFYYLSCGQFEIRDSWIISNMEIIRHDFNLI